MDERRTIRLKRFLTTLAISLGDSKEDTTYFDLMYAKFDSKAVTSILKILLDSLSPEGLEELREQVHSSLLTKGVHDEDLPAVVIPSGPNRDQEAPLNTFNTISMMPPPLINAMPLNYTMHAFNPMMQLIQNSTCAVQPFLPNRKLNNENNSINGTPLIPRDAPRYLECKGTYY